MFVLDRILWREKNEWMKQKRGIGKEITNNCDKKGISDMLLKSSAMLLSDRSLTNSKVMMIKSEINVKQTNGTIWWETSKGTDVLLMNCHEDPRNKR